LVIMRITKFGHACVRVEHAGVRIVLDPGSFTELEAVEGADVVLITHQHADHYDADHLRATTAQIHTIAAVADVIRADAPDLADRLHVVAPGELLDVGVPVRVVGDKHAVIHQDYPRFDNSGYLLDLSGTKVFHPGDALTAPGEAIDLLLIPVSAPWLKVGEVIDLVREVGAPRNLAIHDRIYSEVALGVVESHVTNLALSGAMSYVRLADGADLDI
jgi:L-ascorbate metabolism protein UlaG (beta-lactamase superfamily)